MPIMRVVYELNKLYLTIRFCKKETLVILSQNHHIIMSIRILKKLPLTSYI